MRFKRGEAATIEQHLPDALRARVGSHDAPIEEPLIADDQCGARRIALACLGGSALVAMPAAETCERNETVLIEGPPRRLRSKGQKGCRTRIEAAEQEGVDLPSG